VSLFIKKGKGQRLVRLITPDLTQGNINLKIWNDCISFVPLVVYKNVSNNFHYTLSKR